MIIYKQYSETLTRAYSDAGMVIERDGIRYEEAIDPTYLNRRYTETDVPIDPGPDYAEATIADYNTALRMLGVDTGDEGEASDT